MVARHDRQAECSRQQCKGHGPGQTKRAMLHRHGFLGRSVVFLRRLRLHERPDAIDSTNFVHDGHTGFLSSDYVGNRRRKRSQHDRKKSDPCGITIDIAAQFHVGDCNIGNDQIFLHCPSFNLTKLYIGPSGRAGRC